MLVKFACRPLLAICLLLSLPQSGLGQTTDNTEPGVSRSETDPSTIIYSPDFFNRFNVITATDILRRIPGASTILDTRRRSVRGFGSGGDQILINGERLAGKSNDIGAALDRIQASQVLRVELIRGTSGTLDVRSEGLVINIVVSGDAKAGAGSWRAELEASEGGIYRPAFKVSYGAKKGIVEYFASLDIPNGLRRQLRHDRFIDPAGIFFERRAEEQINRRREVAFSSNLIFKLPGGDDLRLNGLAQYGRGTEREISNQFAVAGDGAESFIQTEPRDVVRDGFKWEIGADYEHRLATGGRIKLLLVHTTDDTSREEDQSVIDTPGGKNRRPLFRGTTDELTNETILRGSYKWDLTPAQNIELGVEGALNALETALVVMADDNGMLAPVDIFNAGSRVQEIRIEGFSTDVWKPLRRLTVEAAVNAEYSELKQNGADVTEKRRFLFVKPRADIRFDITPSNQIRLKVERTVGQLDFGDFVSSFNEDDDRPDAGNPVLVPEKAWAYDLSYEYRLANDGGSVKPRLFYQDISDKLDKVVGNLGGDRSASGNIGPARKYGIELSGSLRLRFLGYPDAVIDASVTRQRSRLTDAFTGQRRPFNFTPATLWNVGFRHDTHTARSFSYGFDINGQSVAIIDDIRDQRRFTRRPSLNAFSELRVLGGMTLRFDAERLLHDRATRRRIRYIGNKVNEVPFRIEDRIRDVSRSFTISLRGNF